MIGQMISHYKILEKLGEGGMGVVYKAQDLKLERFVAIKVLAPHLSRDKEAIARFVHEAKAASALDHSNIGTIHDIDETADGQTFIVMAYYEGETLHDRMKRGGVAVQEALAFASQIASGLAKAHEKGIVHRDIKPSNVIITKDGQAKIMDFGLAKLAGGTKLTRTGKTMGTVSYMSPEQTRGEETGPATDVWALGVVLYEMVAGAPPFRGDYDVAVVYSILNDTPPAMSSVRSDVPEELEKIVMRALAKKASERYESADALYSDLAALKNQIDFSSFTGTREWQFERGKRRSLAVLAGAVAAIAAIAALWRIASERGNPPPGLPGRARELTSGDAWRGDPALSADGGRIAYWSDEAGNRDIYVMNASGGSSLRLTSDPAPDFGPAWFPDGASLAFVSERGGASGIWKMSSLGGGATLLIENAADPAISPDGSRIAFTAILPSGDQWIAVAPLADAKRTTILTGSSDGLWEHRTPAWSPDGRTICYAARQDLWMVPASGGPARRLTRDGDNDQCPAWSSDGKHVYFSSSREGTVALWRVAVRGGAVTRLTQGSGYEYNPSVSGDGSRIAYATSKEPGALYIRDMRAKRDLKLAGVRRGDDCIAAISPNGRKVVFTSDRGGPIFDLWMQELDGAGAAVDQPLRLTEDSAHASCPAFSPDGKWIAYYRIFGEWRDVYTIPASGGQPIRFTDDPSSDVQPAWSPDGSSIAFASQRNGGFRIWTAPVSNGRPAGPPRPVTTDTVYAIGPAWSPDGASIAYIGETDRGAEVWIAPSRGGTPGKRITNGARAQNVRWDPATGSLFVSGTWGEDEVSIRRVSKDGGTVEPLNPPLVLGRAPALGTFDVSLDGGFVLFPRENKRGNIWVHEAKKGTF